MFNDVPDMLIIFCVLNFRNLWQMRKFINNVGFSNYGSLHVIQIIYCTVYTFAFIIHLHISKNLACFSYLMVECQFWASLLFHTAFFKSRNYEDYTHHNSHTMLIICACKNECKWAIKIFYNQLHTVVRTTTKSMELSRTPSNAMHLDSYSICALIQQK